MAEEFLGTCEEALSFLTNPVTGETSWTDVKALTEVCRRVAGFSSYAAVAAEWGESDLRASLQMVDQTLQALDHARPLPADHDGGWQAWLDAYLGGNPQIEILRFETAIIAHQVPAETPTDVDPSIITSAMS